MSEIEYWSNFPAAGGQRRGHISPVLSAKMGTSIEGNDTCEIVAPESVLSPVTRGMVVRALSAGGKPLEYRIRNRQRSLEGSLRTVQGLSMRSELGRVGAITRTVGGLVTVDIGGSYTITEWLDTIILPFLVARGYSFVVRGTIEYTEKIVMPATDTGYSPLSALLYLEAESGKEFQLLANGLTEYRINFLTQINADVRAVLVSSHRNLISLSDNEDDEGAMSAVMPLGSAPSDNALVRYGIGENSWVIGTAVGAGPYWVPLTGYGGSEGPVAFNSQFGTVAGAQAAYLLTKTGTTVQITDSRTSDGAVQVASLTGLTAGDLVQLVADTSATRLYELRNPTATSPNARIVLYDDYTGHRNLARNGIFESFTGLVPDHWTVGGGTAKKYPRTSVTTFALTGGNGGVSGTSLTITAGPADHVVYEGEILLTPSGERFVAATVQLNGSGAGTVTVTAAIALANGSSITEAAGYKNRRNYVLPDDGLSPAGNVLWVPEVLDGTQGATYGWTGYSTLALRSPTFTVKYLTSAARIYAACAWSMRAHIEVDNRDASNVVTTVEANTVYRQMPSMTINKPSTTSKLAHVLTTNGMVANSSVHSTMACSALLSADTDVSVHIFGPAARTVGVGRQYNPMLLRWAMLWIGSSDVPVPPIGDHGNGTKIFQKGNRELVARALGGRGVTVTLRELRQAAGYWIAVEEIVYGGMIALENLGIMVRIDSVMYDMIDADNTQVTLDSQPATLTRFLAERRL